MKVSNWRKKLAATLLAGGLISPATAHAADVDVNLLVNPGFEATTTAMTGDYSAPQILNWSGVGFAYSHNPGVTGIPDYADGDDPPSAGDWYFTANNQPSAGTGDIRAPGVFYQDIAVNAGASGALIASGEGAVRFSAQMSSYLNDNDFGIVHLDFRNAQGDSLGTAQIADTDPGPDNVWSLASGATVMPAGTTTIRTSLFGGVVNSGTDGYIDNVDVQVTSAANIVLFAQVNTTTGQVSIRNLTGAPVAVDYYEITSTAGSLNRTTWSSLQDQNAAGFPAGNGSGNGWEEGGGGGNLALSESYLTGNSVVNPNASVGLGAAFTTSGAQDLVFRYGSVGAQPLTADFNGDGSVDGTDFLAWQRNLRSTGATKAQGDADGDGDVDGTDLAAWKAEFGGGAFGGPSTLVQGFVRYVAAGAAAVPEPNAALLLGLGAGLFAMQGRGLTQGRSHHAAKDKT
jgi:hypothetical protein